jgi:tetratricopeptide (TPR) repeat protein
VSTVPIRPTVLDIGDIMHDAIGAHRAGDLAAAEQGYREVLRIAPGQVQALNLLGVLCGQTGRADEAVALLRRAVALYPSDAELRTNLAVAYEVSGDPTAAATHYARAVELDPAHAAAHFGLGYCHECAGRSAEAIACYRRTIALAPDHARAHNNLGNLLADSDAAAAEAELRRAVALDPGYPEPLNNLGALLLRGGNPAAAVPLLEQAIALRPGYADAMANLGMALRELGRAADGLAMLRAAVAADAAAIHPRWLLANALAERGEGAAAEAVLREALALDAQHPQTRLRLAQLLHHLGRFAEAGELFAPLTGAGPHRGLAGFGLVQTRRFTSTDRTLLADMQAVADDAALPLGERVAAHFALGKAFADLGDPAAAMRHYDAGNALHRATLPRFDRDAHAAFVDRLIATYTPDLFRARRDWASGSERPVLIVGMMRSGTTLLEQMLAAHPAVAAGGELTYWAMAGRSGEALPATAEDAAALIAGYAAELDRIAPDAPRVTDKLPHNVYALGLIHLLFPRARILHCRRDAADVGLSIYRTLFAAPHEFAYDQDDIVFVLRSYERLAAHWRAVLPAERMMEVCYEAMVAEPEATARAVVAFCGLPWDARCLEHTANRRLIRTASAWQARQPVYSDAVGSARRYAPYLGALAALHSDAGTSHAASAAATSATTASQASSAG